MRKTIVNLKARIFSFGLIFAMITSFIAVNEVHTLAAETETISVILDGRAIQFDVPPVFINERLMVPFRKIGEEMGAAVTWDGSSQKVTMILEDSYVELFIHAQTMVYGAAKDGKERNTANLKTYVLDVPPTIVNGSVFVPIRAIGEGFGAKVEYDKHTKTVNITSMPDQVTSIEVSTPKSLYVVGQADTAVVKMNSESGVDISYTLSSDNPEALSISKNGEFKCLAAGKTKITATAANGVTGSIEVNMVDLDTYEQEVLRLINIEREENGLSPLSGNNEKLNEAANIRGKEIVDVYSHTRPSGSTCFTAFNEAGVQYTAAAENIAYGQSTPEVVVDSWMKSEGHRVNILNSNLTYMGVGVEMNSNGVLYWVKIFSN